MATAEDVARWMLAELDKHGKLRQRRAAQLIRWKFGLEFVYQNENGHLAIVREVLEAFRKLTPQDVVWSRGTHLWRRRGASDPPGKREGG